MGWNPAPGPQRGADALPEALSAAHDCRRDRRGEISGAHFVSSREGTWDAFASTPSPSFLPPTIFSSLLRSPTSPHSHHSILTFQSRSIQISTNWKHQAIFEGCKRLSQERMQAALYVRYESSSRGLRALPSSYRSSLPTANSSIAASTLFPFPSSPKQATAHISTTALESAKCRIPQSEPHLPPHSLVR